MPDAFRYNRLRPGLIFAYIKRVCPKIIHKHIMTSLKPFGVIHLTCEASINLVFQFWVKLINKYKENIKGTGKRNHVRECVRVCVRARAYK